MGDINSIYSHGITRDLPLLGKWEFPPIMGTDDIPDSLMGFNYMLSNKDQSVDKTIHFYLDDYQFERLWNKPDTYIPMLKPYRSCLTPDFPFTAITPLLCRFITVSGVEP